MVDEYSPISTPFLRQADAASFLHLSQRSLERFRLEGSGPAFHKLGRRIVYRRDTLEQWAAARTFVSTAEADAARQGGAR